MRSSFGVKIRLLATSELDGFTASSEFIEGSGDTFIVRGTESSGGIPSLLCGETSGARARVFCAVVVSRGDIVESRCWKLVEGWVEETNGGASLGDFIRVDKAQDTSPDWGRAASTINMVFLSLELDVVVVTKCGNIREATAR